MQRGVLIPDEIYNIVHKEMIGIDKQIHFLQGSKRDLFNRLDISYQSYLNYKKRNNI